MDNTSIYVNEPGDAEELRRAIRVSFLGNLGESALTFAPSAGGDLFGQWQEWLQSLFTHSLAPTLVAAYQLAERNQFRELSSLDSRLEQSLSPEAAERSRRAGRQFLAATEGARAAKELDRLRTRVRAGEQAGHFAIVFAVHAATFHVPLRQNILAYLFAEWRGGAASGEWPAKSGEAANCFLKQAGNITEFILQMMRDHDADSHIVACA